LLRGRNVLASSKAAKAAGDPISLAPLARGSPPIKERIMTMRKRVGSILFTVAAAGAIAGLSIGPALASTTLKVKVSGGGSYTAKAVGNTILQQGTGKDAIKVTCKASEGKGSLKSGTYRGKAPVKLGTVSKLSFSKCTGPLGTLSTTVTAKPVLNADSKTKKGKTDAVISNVHVTVSQTGCSFKVTGTAPGYYNNSKHELIMTPNLPIKVSPKPQLTIGDVSGCATLIKNGDHPTYSATYKVSRHFKITSS
jgi:hypothetical protein